MYRASCMLRMGDGHGCASCMYGRGMPRPYKRLCRHIIQPARRRTPREGERSRLAPSSGEAGYFFSCSFLAVPIEPMRRSMPIW